MYKIQIKLQYMYHFWTWRPRMKTSFSLQSTKSFYSTELMHLLFVYQAFGRADKKKMYFIFDIQVGVHNGWCYVEKPSTFHLDLQTDSTAKRPTASPSARRSSRFHIRRNSTGSSRFTALLDLISSFCSVIYLIKALINFLVGNANSWKGCILLKMFTLI